MVRHSGKKRPSRKSPDQAKSQRGPLPAHEALLGKIQRQFDRLEDELDVLEETLIRTGWMPDPVEERKAVRAAAKAARLAGNDAGDGVLDVEVSTNEVSTNEVSDHDAAEAEVTNDRVVAQSPHEVQPPRKPR